MSAFWRELNREVQTTFGRRRVGTGSSVTGQRVVRAPAGVQDLVVQEDDSGTGWDLIDRSSEEKPVVFTERRSLVTSRYLVGGEEGAADEEDAEYRRIWNLPQPSKCCNASTTPAAATSQIGKIAKSTLEPPSQQCVRPMQELPSSESLRIAPSNSMSESKQRASRTAHDQACARQDTATDDAPDYTEGAADRTADVRNVIHASRQVSDTDAPPWPTKHGTTSESTSAHGCCSQISSMDLSSDQVAGNPPQLPTQTFTPSSSHVSNTSRSAWPTATAAHPCSQSQSVALERCGDEPQERSRVRMEHTQLGESNDHLRPHNSPDDAKGSEAAASLGRTSPAGFLLRVLALLCCVARWSGAFILHATLGFAQAHHPRLTLKHLLNNMHSRKCVAQCIMLNFVLFRGALYIYEQLLPAACYSLLGIQVSGDRRYDAAVTLLWAAPAYAICEIVTTSLHFKMAQKILNDEAPIPAGKDPPASSVGRCPSDGQGCTSNSVDSLASTACANEPLGRSMRSEHGQSSALLSVASIVYIRLVYIVFVLQVRHLSRMPERTIPLYASTSYS